MLSFISARWKAGGFAKFELVAAVLYLLLLIPTLRGLSVENDFDIFFAAANRLREGGNMYTAPYIYGLWYYYSPLFACLLVPFTFLHIAVLKTVWLAFSFFMLWRLYKLLRYFVSIPQNQTGMWLISITAITSYHPVYLNLLHGQMTILVLWTCLEGAKYMLENNYLKGAFSYALGINIKVLPVFFFFHYFIKNNFKAIFYVGMAVVVLILLPFLCIRAGFHIELIEKWFALLNPLNKEHVITVGEGGFTDFASLLVKYCSNTKIPTEPTANFLSLNPDVIFWLQMGFRALVLVLAAWIYSWLKPIQNKQWSEFLAVSFILAAIPVSFPHQRDYSFLLSIPTIAAASAIFFVYKTNIPKWLLVLSLLAITAMGSVIFFELFGHKVKLWVYQSRLNGFGGLIWMFLWVIWLRIYTRGFGKSLPESDKQS